MTFFFKETESCRNFTRSCDGSQAIFLLTSLHLSNFGVTIETIFMQNIHKIIYHLYYHHFDHNEQSAFLQTFHS